MQSRTIKLVDSLMQSPYLGSVLSVVLQSYFEHLHHEQKA